MLCTDPIQLFLFQRGKKAFHPSVVITASRAAHALDRVITGKTLTIRVACELAAPVAMKNHATRVP